MLDYIGETRQFWPVHSHTCTHGVSDSAPRTGARDQHVGVRGHARVVRAWCAAIAGRRGGNENLEVHVAFEVHVAHHGQVGRQALPGSFVVPRGELPPPPVWLDP